MLIGAHLSPLSTTSTHVRADPTRTRRLLLRRDEIQPADRQGRARRLYADSARPALQERSHQARDRTCEGRSNTTSARRSRNASGTASSSGCCAIRVGAPARMSAGFTVRAVTPTDVPAIAAIYADNVRSGTATYEYAAPDADEMRRRFRARSSGRATRMFVAEDAGGVASSATPTRDVYRPRPGIAIPLKTRCTSPRMPRGAVSDGHCLDVDRSLHRARRSADDRHPGRHRQCRDDRAASRARLRGHRTTAGRGLQIRSLARRPADVPRARRRRDVTAVARVRFRCSGDDAAEDARQLRAAVAGHVSRAERD